MNVALRVVEQGSGIIIGDFAIGSSDGGGNVSKQEPKGDTGCDHHTMSAPQDSSHRPQTTVAGHNSIISIQFQDIRPGMETLL